MNIDYVQSAKWSGKVEVSSFDLADDAVHMIEWLGRGADFRKFIVDDIENELYAQDKNSQLLSVKCIAKPEYETKLLQKTGNQHATLAEVLIAFPIMLCVKAGDGAIWEIAIRHQYHASNLDVPRGINLRFDFIIISGKKWAE